MKSIPLSLFFIQLLIQSIQKFINSIFCIAYGRNDVPHCHNALLDS